MRPLKASRRSSGSWRGEGEGRREGGEGGKEGGERGREGGRGEEGVTALIFKFGHTEVGTYTHSTVPL